MAEVTWTEGWPVAAHDVNRVALWNDLRAVLNYRRARGAALPEFHCCDNTWNAIKAIRDLIDEQLAFDCFYQLSSGLSYCPTGTADDPADPSLFKEVFGGARTAWKNYPDGTEASGPGYDPPQCGDSRCWAFLLNELHDIIDGLVWQRVGDPSAIYRIYIDALGDWKATKALAIADAWTKLAAATKNYTIGDDSVVWCQMNYSDPNYQVSPAKMFRAIFDFTGASQLPADTQRVYWVTRDLEDNRYDKDVGGVKTATKCPAWSYDVYSGTAAPDGGNAAADWAYGASEGSVNCPDVLSSTGSAEPQVQSLALNNWVAATDFYVQLRMDESQPNFLATDGWWVAGQMFKQIEDTDMMLLYSLVS